MIAIRDRKRHGFEFQRITTDPDGALLGTYRTPTGPAVTPTPSGPVGFSRPLFPGTEYGHNETIA